KPALARAVRVRQAVIDRVLGGQERHDALARDVAAEVRDEMAEIVFLIGADGAVGQKHVRALPGEPAHRVIGIDPRVHALGERELGARRPQLGREDGGGGTKGCQQIHAARLARCSYYIVPMTPAALRSLLSHVPSLPLVASPTLVEPMPRLRAALGGGPS